MRYCWGWRTRSIMTRADRSAGDDRLKVNGDATVPSLRCGFLRGGQLSREERLLLDPPHGDDVPALRLILMGVAGLAARQALGFSIIPNSRGELLLQVLVALSIIVCVFFVLPRVPILWARSACPEGAHYVGRCEAPLERALGSGLGGKAVVVGRSGSVGICTWRAQRKRIDVPYPKMSITLIEPERVVAFAVLGDEVPALLRIVVRDKAQPIYVSHSVRGLRKTFTNWHENPWDMAAP